MRGKVNITFMYTIMLHTPAYITTCTLLSVHVCSFPTKDFFVLNNIQILKNYNFQRIKVDTLSGLFSNITCKLLKLEII